jgi:hypothetical protein
MDIAAFVGFASSGPVNTPVVVEDAARFRDVFGPDVALGRVSSTAETQYGHLGATVEAFFRNGGARCWVVRVAGTSAVSNRFPLAGLVGIDDLTGEWRLAEPSARSEGAWSDTLQVGTLLQTTALPVPSALDVATGHLTMPGAVSVAAGDMLRLSFGTGEAQALLVVSSVDADGGQWRVGWDHSIVLNRISPASLPGSPTAAYAVTVDGQRPLAHVPDLTPGPEPGSYVLTLPEESAPSPRTLVRVDFDDGTTLVVSVGEVAGLAGLGLTDPSGPALIELEADDGWFVSTDPSTLDDPLLPDPVAERLTVAVLAWRGEQLASRVDGLALTSSHSRSWEKLPSDVDLFTVQSNLPGGTGDRTRMGSGVTGAGTRLNPLWEELSGPRFPLAGQSGPGTGVWWPLGVSTVANPSHARLPITDTSFESRLARNGLDSFSASLFLDPDLGPRLSSELLPRAHAKSYIGPQIEPLRGFHSLLPIEEATVVSVPDACHPGWDNVLGERDDPPAGPFLWPLEQGETVFDAWWSAVDGATSYTLQRATMPDFADAITQYRGPGELGPSAPPDASPPTPEAVGSAVQVTDGCPGENYFRVRAHVGGLTTPWSNTHREIIPAEAFDLCDTPIPAPILHLELDSTPETGFLRWNALPRLAVQIQVSSDPGLAGAGLVSLDHGSEASVNQPELTPDYYRIRYVQLDADNLVEGFGPWSNTVTFGAPLPMVTEMQEPARGELNEELLAVQRALLRFCAARGDLIGVLSLPSHYREAEAASHLSELVSPSGTTPANVPSLNSGEISALTYGAMYHPWTAVRVPGSSEVNIRSIPPDGSVSGAIALRSIERGAWIAPANQPLAGVVALVPALDERSLAPLLDRGINILAQQPEGVVSLGSETLSRDSLLRPLSVRRLLILIRRLTLSYGSTYVFEPHGPRFRMMVRRTFEGILLGLYQRGAFAGAVPSEAFRVVADESVNPPHTVDRGQFVVELWVAPSQPLKYLKVRLLQTGPGAVTVVEA